MSVVALYYDIVCLHACGCGPEHEGRRVCTQALYISVLFLLTDGCDSEAKIIVHWIILSFRYIHPLTVVLRDGLWRCSAV